ncbi:MAG: DUF3540 domain-containing protein [Thermodesulfobacteriota bacterium]|nr:DUF3540 domain-containing protein [Thermodesulfobacteriota bacterium]
MKTNVIPIRPSETGHITLTGKVKGVADESVMIETPEGVINAGVAFSCLVAPEPGDRVLFSKSERSCYVLAILERPSGKNMQMTFPGDVRMKTENGRMDLAAGTDLNLMAGENSSLTGSKTLLAGANVKVTAGELSTHADTINTHANKAGIFVDAVDVVARRVTQRAENVMRWVEQIETLHIGSLIQHIRRAMLSHSQHASITASKDVRIDGERIHMG